MCIRDEQMAFVLDAFELRYQSHIAMLASRARGFELIVLEIVSFHLDELVLLVADQQSLAPAVRLPLEYQSVPQSSQRRLVKRVVAVDFLNATKNNTILGDK